MKIKYLGPRAAVEVAPFGPHGIGEIKDYPDEFAEELLKTSKRQEFEAVAARKPPKKEVKKNETKI